MAFVIIVVLVVYASVDGLRIQWRLDACDASTLMSSFQARMNEELVGQLWVSVVSFTMGSCCGVILASLFCCCGQNFLVVW